MLMWCGQPENVRHGRMQKEVDKNGESQIRVIKGEAQWVANTVAVSQECE